MACMKRVGNILDGEPARREIEDSGTHQFLMSGLRSTNAVRDRAHRLFPSLRILSILRLPSPNVDEDRCSDVTKDVSVLRDIGFSVKRLPYVLAAGRMVVLD